MLTPKALNKAIKSKRLKQSDVSRMTGIMPQKISDFIRGRVPKLSADAEKRVLAAFPELAA